MGNTRDTGYLRNLVTYDASGNITLPANLTVTGVITGYATTSYVTTQINNLINGAPGLLDTLDELAAALGDDANFAATLTTSLSGKQASLSGTGFVKVSGTTVSYDNLSYLPLSAGTSYPLTGNLVIQKTAPNISMKGGYTQDLAFFLNNEPSVYIVDDATATKGIKVNISTGAFNQLGGGAATFSGDFNVITAGTTTALIDGTNPTITLRRNNNGNASAAINFKGSTVVKWQIGTNQATGLGFEVNEGDATANRFYIAPGGAATFSNNITAYGSITVINGIYTLPALTPSYFGYSGYGVLIVGNSNSAQTRSIAFNVDVSGNPSGAFNGYGSEYIWRNAGSFITPNSINNGYNTLLSWNNNGQMTFSQAATFSNTISASVLRSLNSGVDATYQDAFVGVYSSNNNEQNAIQTSVSSVAASSGFRFQVSNGGGSSARTTMMTLTRSNLSVSNEVIVGAQGGTDTTYISGGSGYGSVIRNIYAGGSINNELRGNGNNYFNVLLGSMGVGTNNPQYTLDVNGSGRFVGALYANNTIYGTRIIGGNLIAGNMASNMPTSPSYILIVNINDIAGFSMSGKVNAASYTCWNISDIWIEKDYSSTVVRAGIEGKYKSGCDFSIVDISYGAGRYVAFRFTSNPEVDVLLTGYRLTDQVSGGSFQVITSGVTVNGTYASY